MKKSRPILCVDFDGVLHSYSSGWQGARKAADPPVEHAIQWLLAASEVFEVCIYSSRSRQFLGKRTMKKWLIKHITAHIMATKETYTHLRVNHEQPNYDRWAREVKEATKVFIKRLKFPTKKPAAFMTIDDRAYCFEGRFPSPKHLLNFKPWNKREVYNARK